MVSKHLPDKFPLEKKGNCKVKFKDIEIENSALLSLL